MTFPPAARPTAMEPIDIAHRVIEDNHFMVLGTAQPDCALVDASMAPMLARKLAADVANLQMRPEVAALIAVQLSFTGRDAVALALLRGDLDTAVRLLRRAF